MAQRQSEYARIDGDTYVTPQWVFKSLDSVERFDDPWDCAPVERGYFDFLRHVGVEKEIVTNPPFRQSFAFVMHSLNCTQPCQGKVAMLLPHAWDTAKSRVHLFDRAPFKAKYTLTKRIRWENLEQKKNGPSMNHAWFVWDWAFQDKPFMGWL
jgi:hypothetical protein